MHRLLFATLCGVWTVAAAARAAPSYPWLSKSQDELTHAECSAAARHDGNYWWSRGRCHMRFIRYAAGVALRDTRNPEEPEAVLKKGELIEITQYRPKEGLYCGHGAGCYPSKDIKLLGSVLIRPNDDQRTGDESDLWQSVDTTCELILADKVDIVKAGAQALFKDCR